MIIRATIATEWLYVLVTGNYGIVTTGNQWNEMVAINRSGFLPFTVASLSLENINGPVIKCGYTLAIPNPKTMDFQSLSDTGEVILS